MSNLTPPPAHLLSLREMDPKALLDRLAFVDFESACYLANQKKAQVGTGKLSIEDELAWESAFYGFVREYRLTRCGWCHQIVIAGTTHDDCDHLLYEEAMTEGNDAQQGLDELDEDASRD